MVSTAAHWVPTGEALRHLSTCRQRLREAQAVTPADFPRPWTDNGHTGRAARYTWDLTRIDAWWREVSGWLRAARTKTASTSDGETPTVRLVGSDSAPRSSHVEPQSVRPANTSPKSKKQSSPANAGSALDRFASLG